MILQNLDFSKLFSRIEILFFSIFGDEKYGMIKKSLTGCLNNLALANLHIYKANMEALEYRKNNHLDLWVYSELELKARQAGERRVRAKIEINRMIGQVYPRQGKEMLPPQSWMSDDVVYSVAEMIDRLIIEEIKQEDYRINYDKNSDRVKELEQKLNLSSNLNQAVEECLESKLEEINKKGYYDYIEETRTYNIQDNKTMILENINFVAIYRELEKIFSDNLPIDKLQKMKDSLREQIETLAKANFLCYQANMKILEARRNKVNDPKVYSDLDWRVRLVGEHRVLAKSNINKMISQIFDKNIDDRSQIKTWTTNDVVYSLGDMIDRIIIEFIKIADFKSRLENNNLDTVEVNNLKSKICLAEEWSRRVKEYLAWKLQESNKKGFYQYLPETRTYNIKHSKDIDSLLKENQPNL